MSAAMSLVASLRLTQRVSALRRAVLVLALASLSPMALAHEGHDHGAPVAVAPNPSAQPRFVAASEDFEVVGVLSKDRLTLYLDDAKSNAPIDGATLEVSVDALVGKAVREAPGTYSLLLKAPLAAGKHALTLTVDAPNGSDLLATTLEVGAMVASAERASAVPGDSSIRSLVIAGGVVLLLAGGLGLAYSRRKNGALPRAGK